MRRLLGWLGAAFGGLALYRVLARPHPHAAQFEAPFDPPVEDSRAEELRRKLAESRALVEEREAFEEGEVTVDRADPAAAGPDERRREVHEHGRAAADEMRASGRPPRP
jgi:hypothetical protein